MKYGLSLPNFGGFGSARVMADWAKDAESAGWDGFFVWDHIARPVVDRLVDPWVALTAVAMNTETIQIGTMVTPLPRRRPWQVARQTASLDQLSGGRLILGVGIGSSRPQEWDAFGEELDTRKRGQMLDEGLDVVTGLWTGEPFAYEGQYYQVQDSQFIPTPYRNQHIPIWVGGKFPAKPPMRRAARWDGMLIDYTAEQDHRMEEFRQSIEFVLSERRGDSPFDIVYIDRSQAITPREEVSEIAREAQSYGATWWMTDLTPPRFDMAWDSVWNLDVIYDWMMQGPPR